MSDRPPELGDIDEATWQRLADAARDVRDCAHVPYSSFPVGAALLTDNGEIITGCNVENATIGATVCAERNAIGCAVSAGHRTFRALAIVTEVDPPAAPCGICRQVLAEFCDDLPILLLTPEGQRRTTTLDELLPMRFSGLDFNHD